MAQLGDSEARLLKLLDDAKTFDELVEAINAAEPSHAVFGYARQFIADADPAGLDEVLRERFAQVLSRFVESRRALKLAGVLEAG